MADINCFGQPTPIETACDDDPIELTVPLEIVNEDVFDTVEVTYDVFFAGEQAGRDSVTVPPGDSVRLDAVMSLPSPLSPDSWYGCGDLYDVEVEKVFETAL